ncbi:unnamed protein product [Tilletia laevis]|uniref:Uncharacterized protein n=1 Tax=Tilletia laevis TaxID=157183 RepID=A0A9N8MBE3_9BASI|nr:unnamed protein product [Tilletia laevis]CAD6964599.1 unnamed protein product [Tilletia laevis]CAD7061995.1 unnamed protein product [Tilletia caries]
MEASSALRILIESDQTTRMEDSSVPSLNEEIAGREGTMALSPSVAQLPNQDIQDSIARAGKGLRTVVKIGWNLGARNAALAQGVDGMIQRDDHRRHQHGGGNHM